MEYQKLTQRQHVLLRPDTYIGTTHSSVIDRFVCNDQFKIVEERVSFCPGLLQLFLEILNNARDRTVVDNEIRCSRIEVNFYDDFEFSITNNGDSILIERHPTENIYNPELIFGHLLTSSNYDDSVRRIVGGRNGFGAKLANIYSSKFSVEIADHRTSRTYAQTWTDNMENCQPPVVTQTKKVARPYTCIRWKFDKSRFPDIGTMDDFVKIIRKSVVDVAATVSSNVTVLFQGLSVPCSNLTTYSSMFPCLEACTERFFSNVNDRWKIGVIVVPEGGKTVSFVNGMWTNQGGTHETHAVNQIVEHITQTLTSRAKGNDRELVEKSRFGVVNRLIRERLWFFVDACIENPEFTSQTKECLKTPARSFGSSCTFGPAFMKKMAELSIYEVIMDALRGKSQQSLKSTDGRKVTRIIGIDKYDSAPWAGTFRSDECLLIVTEGDSAKGTAIAGLKARQDRERFGVFPLRGKVLNVRNATASELNANAEFKHLKQILGLQQGRTYESWADLKTLRYGGLIVFTDQDTDGYHIKALVMNIFATFWPKLLEKGFVRSLPTPIVKVTRGVMVREFYDLNDFREFQSSEDLRGCRVKYYKGLGTSTAEEARTYFTNFQMVKYTGPQDSVLMDRMFSKDHTDYRKQWVMDAGAAAAANELDNPMDPGTKTIDEFVHREYIQHAVDNLERTIPNVIDGLKPSQRKILFGCFHEGLANSSKEMKVAQLGAAVAKVTQYHHGEVSLMSAIINMAQNFVGSNNVNLLEPVGQFGTRLMGGKDAASPRYTFTRLSEVCKKIFRTEDHPILKYLEEENESIEPSVYIPIVPLVLINGADGIGTGFSTYLPPSDPREVIQEIRKMIRGDFVDPLWNPWWRNFQGTITMTEPDKYTVTGCYERVDDRSIHITELPVGTWTTPYKTFLDDLVKEGKIRDYTCVIDDTNVDIHVDLNDRSPPAPVENIFEAEIQRKRTADAASSGGGASNSKKVRVNTPTGVTSDVSLLKLTTKVSTSNVHLFSSPFESKASIRKYTIRDIYNEFYAVRLRAYTLRKEHQVNKLEDTLTVVRARIDFIRAKVDGRLVIENRDIDEVYVEMEQMGLPRRNGEYDYLLDMKLSSLTRQRIETLSSEFTKLTQELEELKNTSESTMWLRELDELERIL